MAADEILSSLGLDGLVDDGLFGRDSGGTRTDWTSARVLFAPPEAMRGLYFVLEQEKAGAWGQVMKAGGYVGGHAFANNLDTRLSDLGKPALAALPLEACLVFVERHFSANGWGRLKLDLTDAAEHGLVIARVEHSYFAEVLPPAATFVDPLLAGILQGFFEYISGQKLGCEEIGCVRRGAPHCTFVITAPERLATILPRVGLDSADQLLGRLRT